jgi:hypothetical protein
MIFSFPLFKKISFLIAMAVCFAIFAACSTSKKTATSTEMKNLSIGQLQQMVAGHNVDFDWFSGKARVIVRRDQDRIGGTIHIRMQKNQFIWLSIQKLGFEIARAYIRPDSAFVIDRFNRDYYAEDLTDYLNEYHVPFSFDELQGLLLGNIPYEKGKRSRHRIEEGNYYLSQQNSQKLFFEYVLGSDQKINRVFVRDLQERKVFSSLSDYQSSGERNIPHNIEHFIEDRNESVGMEIDYSSVEFDVKKNVPFEIPSHYTRIQ